MGESYYRTGQVAKQLGVSPHHIRRLCEAGVVEADVSDGHQWRVPSSEVERLREEGVPPIPQVVRTLPEETQPSCQPVRQALPADPVRAEPQVSPEVRDAYDDLIITETELKKRKLEREREEVEDFFREREQRVAAERAAQTRAQQQAAADTRKRQWAESWQAHALGTLPFGTPPDCKIDVHREVAAVLVALDASTPQYITRELVDAAVRKALAPYTRRKEIAEIIDRAIATLPYNARGFSRPTEWEIKAREAVSAKLPKLGSGAATSEIRSAAEAAVATVTTEFQDGEARKQVREHMRWWRLFDANETEREAAQQAAEKAMAQLPVGTPRATLEKVAETAANAIGKQVERRRESERTKRCAEEQADTSLLYVREYLSAEYDFTFSELLETERELKDCLRPELVSVLECEPLDADDIRGWIEASIDDLLDG